MPASVYFLLFFSTRTFSAATSVHSPISITGDPIDARLRAEHRVTVTVVLIAGCFLITQVKRIFCFVFGKYKLRFRFAGAISNFCSYFRLI